MSVFHYGIFKTSDHLLSVRSGCVVFPHLREALGDRQQTETLSSNDFNTLVLQEYRIATEYHSTKEYE